MHKAGATVDLTVKSKVYRGRSLAPVAALRDLHLSIAPGEFVVLMGPSGCGKTTLLRILTGLDEDFEGKLTRDSHAIGMVFQEPRLLPWRTVQDNIALVSSNPAPGFLKRILDECGLSDLAGRFPRQLSLGQQRRAALARAFAVDPDLVVLDEAFVSLDNKAAQKLRAVLVAALEERQTTVVMVTHDLREALSLASRLILLSPGPGRVVEDIPLRLPRQARDEAWIGARQAELAPKITHMADHASASEAPGGEED
jgi:ABC-type nitrate/sulfonate/bicarbonate transport system ATPase subunit